MTAYQPQAALINEVLSRLGVLAAGQAADPEDYSYVLGMIDPTMRKLAGLEIVYIPDTTNVPSIYFSDLADILAGETCTKFGATPDDYVKLVSKGLGGVNGIDIGAGAAAISLRQMTRGKPTYERQTGEYF